MLLHWCTLEPAGPSSLAALRFARPIRIRSIRIFPTNARPFAQNPGIIAYVAWTRVDAFLTRLDSRTEPDAFLLDVYLNAHSTAADSKNKPKAPNALVPTTIAYSGGCMDFAVDMAPEVCS